MARSIVFDEIHVTLRIPNELPETQCQILRRTLMGKEFLTRLRRAARDVVRAYPDLEVVRVTLSR